MGAADQNPRHPDSATPKCKIKVHRLMRYFYGFIKEKQIEIKQFIHWKNYEFKDNIPKRNTKSFFIILQNGILNIMNIIDYSKKRRYLSLKLVEAREQAGFSQKQVADSQIVSQSELSKIENGGRRVDFLVLLELTKYYNQPISFFIPDNKPDNK